jgi:putative transcriptional regulator
VIAEVVHEGVRGTHRLGLVDKKTMREFHLRCLTAVEHMTPETFRLCESGRA